MSQKDLVVKMTINSQDFDNGLKNAKSSMNKFQKDTLSMSSVFKSAMGAMTKAFAGLGIAMVATEIFKSFMKSTQIISDKWDNAMVSAKTSFQVFEQAVVLGNGTILSNFKQSIAAAREFAQAMDNLGSAQISNKYARMEYVTPFQEAMTKYRDMKSSGNATGMAFAASDMQRYLNAYSDNAMNLLKASTDAVTAKLSSYTGGFINSGNVDKYLDQLYLEIVNGVFPPILQDFNNLKGERRKGDAFFNAAKKEMEQKYGPGWRREAEAMKALSEINDETLNEMLGIIQTYDQVRNEINGMRRQMNKALNGTEGGGGGGKTYTAPAVTTPKRETAQLIPELPALQNYDDLSKKIEEVGVRVQGFSIIQNENMQELAMNVEYAKLSFEGFGNVLSGVADLAGDNPFGNLTKGLSGVVSQAAATAAALMSLAGVETLEGVAEVFSSAPPFMKLAMAATALSGILGMVGAVKGAFAGSFANGGVVPGSSYTGDQMWARVNSGELIIPYNDWHNANAGGNVNFVIEGSQLRGVLDNYDKTEAL